MRSWPTTLPDYQWPAEWLTARHAPRRWLLATWFYAAWVAGRIVRALFGGSASILLIRTDGIGDAVLFEPLLQALANRLPHRKVSLWAPFATCELFSSHPDVAQCVPILRGAKRGNLDYFNSPSQRRQMGYLLGRHTFAAAFHLAESPEPFGNWLFRSVSADEKWLNRGDLQNQFDWQRERTIACATQIVLPRPGGGHELLRNAHLASQCEAGPLPSFPSIAVARESEQEADSLMDHWNTIAAAYDATGVIGVMPSSAMAIKGYPAESWRQVIRRIWHEDRQICALFGSLQDASLLDEISLALPEVPHVRLPGGTALPTVAALLGQLNGFVSVDTGLAHLAMARGAPTVVLCTGGHPGRFFPWPGKTRSIVLNVPMSCEGCRCRCIRAEAECVTRIEPVEVVEALRKVMMRPPSDMPGRGPARFVEHQWPTRSSVGV